MNKATNLAYLIVLLPLTGFILNKPHTIEELNFIKEVNLAREHPREYVSYIKAYSSNWGTDDEKKATPEAISVMEKMSPLKPLIPSEQIREELEQFNAIDTLRRWVNHGNWKWLKSPYKGSGGENIIGSCSNTYRNMVIRHLIDGNVPNRGHRKNILNPKINTIAVKRIVFGDESKPFQCRIWWVEEYLEI
jgi:hypothetical protein